MESNSQSDNGQSQEIEPVVCKKARPMDNENSMIATADVENIIQTEGAALTAPQENQKVYKDECVYCYRTPFFPGGLYVCLKKFVALCPHHIGHYAEKHPESRLYLAMKYELQEKDEKKEVVRKHALVAYPNIDAECDVDDGKIPEPLSSVLQAVIDHKSAHIQQNTEQGLDWDGTEVYESDLVNNLIQLDVQKSIPEGGWVCEQEGCDIRQNLWLNLSDAVVMCGRLSHGSKYEGRAHAEAHSRETGFPLVVRVATIENEVGECFQYDLETQQYINDRYVKNPHLKKQLAHFGLDINKFEKTEEHRDVLNMEYNQTEFFAIQEQGTELQAVYGPGFTGLINLGSSCYINSLIQVLGTVPDFMQYCANQAQEAFKLFDPVQSFDDFTFQLVKLMCCLNSTDYSQTASELNGIKPVQFRRVAGKNHPEFSTAKQQDVEQYARHIFEKIDAVVLKADENPVNALRFIFRTRFQDVASQYVRYREHRDCILPVTIPIDFAEQSATDAERKAINLEQCLMATFADGFIDGYESPITHERKGALEAIRMGSFPDYLLIQLKRFTYTNEGTQQKMMVDVNNVDEIDLSAYLSNGLQPGEQQLPGEQTTVDDNLVAQVMEMGFDLNAAKQAVVKTKNAGAEVAVNWLMDHLDEIQPEAAPVTTEPSQLPVRQGNGSYELQAFISHIGSKPDSGHYVAHIKKGDSWYIFNDEKVAVSQNPPKAMGYIYLYKRK
ncbi:ubiquitin carboxyl-terminal hydrolase domain-containing protein [Ditylenchus destructor]|nr:ubiquitin carboxyl-terminal hydrolase domain-containing protein [Ditylenchus destructor]